MIEMKKGISPVIAIVMLLLIVVVMVGGVFAWMTGMQDDIEGAGDEQVAAIVEEASGYVRIIDVSCDDDGDYAKHIWIRNDNPTRNYNPIDVFLDGDYLGDIELKTNDELDGDKSYPLDLLDNSDDDNNLDEWDNEWEEEVSGRLVLNYEGENIETRNIVC